jgi:hypothetical protein
MPRWVWAAARYSRRRAHARWLVSNELARQTAHSDSAPARQGLHPNVFLLRGATERHGSNYVRAGAGSSTKNTRHLVGAQPALSRRRKRHVRARGEPAFARLVIQARHRVEQQRLSERPLSLHEK